MVGSCLTKNANLKYKITKILKSKSLLLYKKIDKDSILQLKNNFHMNFKFVYFNILLFVCNISFAQTHIVDIDDNAPIPFIHVISDKGTIVGTSNIDGVIDLKSISAVTGSVSFHHISYQSKEIKMENLIKSDTIKLTKNNFMMPEIVITDKSLKPVYLLLKGFYRSYQIENGIPKYYTDGIVEFSGLNSFIFADQRLKHHLNTQTFTV